MVGDRVLVRLVSLAVLGLAMVTALLETAYLPSFHDAMEMGYVDFARHIARGAGMSTSMLAPYYLPKIPSPISLWPPLYPALIAGVSKLGLAVPVAARAISIVMFGVTAMLVWLLAAAVFGRTTGAVAAVLFSLWPPATRIGGMALSENLFMAAVLVSLLIGVRLLRPGPPASRWYAVAAGSGLAMGLAALTRYVGLALIAIGAAALLASIRGRTVRERITGVAVWAVSAAVLPALVLLRNVLVTGALIGAGRPPNERRFAYHVLFSIKTVALDGLQLLWRITVLPEALGVNVRVLAGAVVVLTGVVVYGAIRSPRVRAGVRRIPGALAGSPEGRFVMTIAAGYWIAMLVAREQMGFMALSTRMMIPLYPLLLIGAVAAIVAVVQALGVPARRTLTAAVVALCLASVLGVILPRSLAAGGPRLQPDPPPSWVAWVAAHTPPGTPIVGNGGFDYTFFLERPVLSFASYLEYRTGNRFERDCRTIARNLATLGWRHAVLILHAEDTGLDEDLMGRRYGPTIVRLLRGEKPLPVRQITRQPEFVAFEILDLAWDCDQT